MSTARPVPFNSSLSVEARDSIWVRLMRLIGVARRRAGAQVAATTPALNSPSRQAAGRIAALSSEGVPPGVNRVHDPMVTKTKRRAQAAARRPGLPGRWKASDRVGPNIPAI